MDGGSGERWNHNIHHHPVVLGALPPMSGHGLDVGCGEGVLTRVLRARVAHMVGLDVDEPSLALARSSPVEGVEYVLGDILAHPFQPESFDVIVSVAALHHMEPVVALARMRRLLRPGGRLVVVGLARSGPADLPLDVVAAVASRWYKRTRPYWDHSAPTVWPPPLTYGQTRRMVTTQLPGARYRRHLLFRWSAVWTKPGGEPD